MVVKMTCCVYLDQKGISDVFGHSKALGVIERYRATIKNIDSDGVWINKVFVISLNSMEEAVDKAKTVIWEVLHLNQKRAVHVPLRGCICITSMNKPVGYETAMNTFRLYSSKPEIYITEQKDYCIPRPIVVNDIIVMGGFITRISDKVATALSYKNKVFYVIACSKKHLRCIDVMASRVEKDLLVCFSTKYPSDLLNTVVCDRIDAGHMVVCSISLECHEETALFDMDIARYVAWLYKQAESNDIDIIVSYDLYNNLRHPGTEHMQYKLQVFEDQVCYTGQLIIEAQTEFGQIEPEQPKQPKRDSPVTLFRGNYFKCF